MTASGLEGIVAAETALSSVDGEAGELIIGGYAVEDLAPNATFEETAYLLWHGHLPDADELIDVRNALVRQRRLPTIATGLLRQLVPMNVPVMDALRIAAGTLGLESLAGGDGDTDMAEAIAITAQFPGLVAAYWRLAQGLEPVEPLEELGHTANYLYMLNGQPPSDERVRALETYLSTVVDHGLNASTFTARVITSTGSDLVSAIVGAVGALKGPLHGGAPGPALDMVFEIGSEERIDPCLRGMIERGDRLMGFGHRVYKVRDPRADVLGAGADILYRNGGDMALYRLARRVESRALELLEEYKPGRRLQTNVEYYTALLLHGIGLPVPLFTPTFAVGRVVGWIAHALEQRRTGRLIRPQSAYTGPARRGWVPIERR
jgi:citrate synthase